MLPNSTVGRLKLGAIVALLLTATALFLRQSPNSLVSAGESSARLERAEQERQAATVRAESIEAHAAEARAATPLAVAHAESLRERVRVETRGKVQIDGSVADGPVVIPVPPLVTDRLQADSVAIGALSVALTWDAKSIAALDERLVAEAKVRDAASLTIKQLEGARSPRCGRRCGFVLGAASVVALGIATDQTRRLLHP